VASSAFLIMYSEADDAPGGVLLGLLLAICAVALAARTVRSGT
jgi:hypothetical protein